MSGDSVQREVERRIVTVLFCDLAGFTSLSERLDAEDVAIVQGAYFDAVRYAVSRYGGTLEKFIGDAAVAVFGVPTAGEQDAERAVRCGFAITGAIEQLAARIGLDEASLHVRVGVNTGEAVVHPAPAPGEAMVTGDVVNTAARLQAAAPLNGVLLGAETALAVAHAVELEPVEELVLKGKAAPVRAARAVSLLAEPERERAMGALGAPTIGREVELSLLATALETCAGGAARRLTVIAPPGTGKSRLLDEMANLALERGAAVRRARVRPDTLSAFRPVVELVGDAFASAGLAGGGALHVALMAKLGDERGSVVADELSALLGDSEGGGDHAEAEARRSARFAAWSEGLATLGAGPEVWLVEDVHWSGSDLRAFLASAAGGHGRGRLIVCTARPSILDFDRGWVENGETLALEPLSTFSTGELVRALVGDALTGELVSEIADKSGGNPLFVEEVVRSWAGSGLLVQSPNGWRLARPVSDVGLPTTVQSIYAAQLDDLPDAARLVIRRASVAGRQFPRGALAALGAQEAEGLDALERRGIVRGPISDDVLGECFVIRHALLRDVGYASLSRAERARLHLRMAGWLEAVGAAGANEVAEVIGRHYAAALDSGPTLASDLGDGVTREVARVLAATWFERGAHAALSSAAYDAAGALFERALAFTADDASMERARLLTGFARATAFTSDMAAGLRAAEEALALLRACLANGDAPLERAREEVSRTLSLVGTIYGQQLRFHEMVALADDGLAELGDQDDAVTVRLLLTRIRGAAMIGDEAWRRAEPDRTRALELARALADPELELEARMLIAGEEPTRSDWMAIEELAQDLRRWPDVADARRTLAALCLPDDLDGVLAAADRLTSFAQAHQLDESAAWADYYRAEAGFVEGSWDAGLEAGLRAITVAEKRSYHRVAVRSWHAVVPIAAARGDGATLERAVRWYDQLEGYPDTPYGRISRAGVEILFARTGLRGPYAFDLDELGPSIAEGGRLPSWLESVDTVVSEALSAGEIAAARRALKLFTAASRSYPSRASDGVQTLLEARVRFAERGEAGAARDAARVLRSVTAPWQLLKCLRLLLDDGLAQSAEHEEARKLEARLGIRAG